MWTYGTGDEDVASTKLDALAAMLGRDRDTLAGQVLVGNGDDCAAKLSSLAEAGVDTVFIWPLGDPIDKLHRFGSQVAPHVTV